MPISYIAVFGDLHGHLRLMLQLCSLWQVHSGKTLCVVFQCGDLGFFPRPAAADTATRRFAKKDPEEFGFARWFASAEAENDSLVSRILEGPPADRRTVRCPVIWCHGNHEDFRALSKVTVGMLSPVDRYGAFSLLRSGEIVDVAGFRLAALGGAPEAESRSGTADVSPGIGKYVSQQASKRLSEHDFDVLLAHAGPASTYADGGSERIRSVIDERVPSYMFYSHHGRPVAPVRLGSTCCHYLRDVSFDANHLGERVGKLHAGCMGILEWRSPEQNKFTVVDDDWIQQVTGTSWLCL